MKLIARTTLAVLFFSILSIYFSCRRQSLSETENNTTKNQIKTITPRETVSEIDSSIMIVFQDQNNNYWFGSKEKGVYKYDGKNLTPFTIKDGLVSNRIRSIQEDKLGNLYFNTEAGISKFDGQNFQTITIENNSVSKNEWKLNPDDLWFAGKWNENGPYRYDGKSLYHLEFPNHDLEEEFYSKYPNASFNPYDVYTIFKDSKGDVWFGTSTFGACRFDGESLYWIRERALTEIDGGASMGVRSILEDKDGYFWFGSNINHKYKVNQNSTTSDQSGLNYKKMKGIETSKEPGLNNYFMSIEEDENGAIWMLTYEDGVWRYDGESISRFLIKEGEKNINLFSIYKDKQNSLWLGTLNGGAYKFNGEIFERFTPIIRKE